MSQLLRGAFEHTDNEHSSDKRRIATPWLVSAQAGLQLRPSSKPLAWPKFEALARAGPVLRE
jgi:hypothetical protein